MCPRLPVDTHCVLCGPGLCWGTAVVGFSGILAGNSLSLSGQNPGGGQAARGSGNHTPDLHLCKVHHTLIFQIVTRPSAPPAKEALCPLEVTPCPATCLALPCPRGSSLPAGCLPCLFICSLLEAGGGGGARQHKQIPHPPSYPNRTTQMETGHPNRDVCRWGGVCRAFQGLVVWSPCGPQDPQFFDLTLLPLPASTPCAGWESRRGALSEGGEE